MLIHLTIKNYALIDHLDIGFSSGFTAITGETGAGKSIMVDALELALGKRADNQVLLDPGKKCIVEAVFDMTANDFRPFFDDHGLDFDHQTTLRREINPNGKSRAFINDTPVPLSQLKTLGDQLVDIHAQHATSSLHEPAFQLSVVDNYAGLADEAEAFRHEFRHWQANINRLKDLRQTEDQAKAALDYQQFLLDELKQADLHTGEQEELEESLKVLTHAEEIKSALYQVMKWLNDDDSGGLNLLAMSEHTLQKVAGYHNGIRTQLDRLTSNLIDLRDICSELNTLSENIGFSQEMLDQTHRRLDQIYRLQQKHHVATIDQLLEIFVRIENELEQFSSVENQIHALEAEISDQKSRIDKLSRQLSTGRIACFPGLSKEIIRMLHHMGMPEARLDIRQLELKECSETGIDLITFYFNANVGHTLKPLSDIASGGELSRVMLAIKSVISDRRLLPTILFDEIDSGLSGDIAGRVGDVLAATARKMQVLAVTHLPQIAGKAHHHYSVFKLNINNITCSNIRPLDRKERISELAKLIGGREITAASLAAAEELLTSNPENN